MVAVECPRVPGPAPVARTLYTLMCDFELSGIIYADVHDPLGLALVIIEENPVDLVT